MELREVFEPIITFLKNFQKKQNDNTVSKDKAKERLQLVLMQDRASVSPDFFEMMKKEIIEVIKKYIEIDEELLEVQLTRGFENDDGTGPALYANIPIKNIKPVAKKKEIKEEVQVLESLTEEEAKEVTENIISEIKEVAESKINKDEKIEKIEQIEEEAKEQIEEIEEVEEEIEEASENIDTIQSDEEYEEEASDSAPQGFKSKFSDVKNSAQETFSKVKSSAKGSFQKIKSKVKAKNQ